MTIRIEAGTGYVSAHEGLPSFQITTSQVVGMRQFGKCPFSATSLPRVVTLSGAPAESKGLDLGSWGRVSQEFIQHAPDHLRQIFRLASLAQDDSQGGVIPTSQRDRRRSVGAHEEG